MISTSAKIGSFGAFPDLSNLSAVTSFSVGEVVVQMLEKLGVKYAFGIIGGAIAPLASILQRSNIKVLHFRHEAGAAFAAIEAYFASGKPVVVFTTAGPGITNALTGMMAARWEGAKVIFVSPSTSAAQRGRWAFQETSTYTMPFSGLFTSGPLFHYAASLETGAELSEVAQRLTQGLAQTGGFVAHLTVPTAIQSSPCAVELPSGKFHQAKFAVSQETINQCVELLSEGRFGMWVGFGARGAAAEIRALAERTGAAVMCSPRGKGIFPENHPQFVGVTGFGGDAEVLRYMEEFCPRHLLVLGTRLGEFTSFWNPRMVPPGGFVHVDIDPSVPGTAYPEAETFSVPSDVGIFVRALLEKLPASPAEQLPHPQLAKSEPDVNVLVRPEELMAAIQRVIVEGSDAVVMTEAGNSFAWGTHCLRFNAPGRYRVSTGFGSMGHAVTGVLGAALVGGKAVAIAGDGAMLMNGGEISTAVQYNIPAVWIVLNDGSYNMINQGMKMQKIFVEEVDIPDVNFVEFAHSLGADGMRVERESQLVDVLQQAMVSLRPFVVDVAIDPHQIAPIGSRVQSLIAQGS